MSVSPLYPAWRRLKLGRLRQRGIGGNMGWTKFLREHTSPDNSCALSQSDKTASKVRLVTMAIARASLERCLGHERACNLKPVSPPSGTSKDSELLELLPMVGCVGWDWLACSCQDASCRIQEHNQTQQSCQQSTCDHFSSDIFFGHQDLKTCY